jgi:hypothetical protein
MVRMQQVINDQGHPKRNDQGVETIARDGLETTTTMIDLCKLRLASQVRMVGRMTIATTDFEAAIETNQAPAGRCTNLGHGMLNAPCTMRFYFDSKGHR